MLSTPVRYCANVTASPALKMSWKKRKSTSKNPTMRATASAFFTFPLSSGDLGLRLSSPETHLYAANANRRHPRALIFTSSQREGAAVRSGPGGSDAIGSGASAAETGFVRPDASGDIAERSPTPGDLVGRRLLDPPTTAFFVDQRPRAGVVEQRAGDRHLEKPLGKAGRGVRTDRCGGTSCDENGRSP